MWSLYVFSICFCICCCLVYWFFQRSSAAIPALKSEAFSEVIADITLIAPDNNSICYFVVITVYIILFAVITGLEAIVQSMICQLLFILSYKEYSWGKINTKAAKMTLTSHINFMWLKWPLLFMSTDFKMMILCL